MPIVRSIEQRGFLKWYERELVRSHSHLVLLVLCTVAALGALEAFSRRDSDRALMFLSLLAAAGVGAWALRRYLYFLMRAELIANQASCGRCEAYGRWQVVASDAAADAAEDDAVEERPGEELAAMAVRCRKCGHRWRIEW